MNRKEKALEYFRKGYNCAQAVFASFCDVTGYSEEDALRLASSFGGGMGRMREVCGTCSAMFMIAGILRGYSDANDTKAKKEHYELIQSLAGKFKEKHGTIICRELLSSLHPDEKPTPSERTESYYKERPCAVFVADAVEILESCPYFSFGEK
ncbi:MAG: C-GCAxxG-C-C family protein [Eubacteriales bacterium]